MMDNSYEKQLISKREKINEIDEKLAELFAERMNLSIEIGLLKKEFGKDVLDSSRESELKSRLLASFANEDYKKYYESFIDEILSSSKDIQKKL